MVPFENRTKCPVFEWSSKTDLQNVRFSNDSGFRMSGVWIPTVPVKSEYQTHGVSSNQMFL